MIAPQDSLSVTVTQPRQTHQPTTPTTTRISHRKQMRSSSSAAAVPMPPSSAAARPSRRRLGGTNGGGGWGRTILIAGVSLLTAFLFFAYLIPMVSETIINRVSDGDGEDDENAIERAAVGSKKRAHLERLRNAAAAKAKLETAGDAMEVEEKKVFVISRKEERGEQVGSHKKGGGGGSRDIGDGYAHYFEEAPLSHNDDGAAGKSSSSLSSVCVDDTMPTMASVLGIHRDAFVGSALAARYSPSSFLSDWVMGEDGNGNCAAGSSSNGGGKGSSVTPSTATQRRYALCYHKQNRFLFFGNNWGRHSNQLTSLAAALVLGKQLNRTIIVPPLFPDHTGKKQGSAAGSVELIDLYAIELLLDVDRSPFCVLSEQEFYQLERERAAAAKVTSFSKRGGGGGVGANNNKDVAEGNQPPLPPVPAVCMTMRGIKTFPRHPKNYRFDCKKEIFIKFKKDLGLFLRTATSTAADGGAASNGGSGAALESADGDSTAASGVLIDNTASPQTARVLTVPLMIYYAAKVPLPSVLCVWKLLQPHPVIRDVMSVYRQEYVGSAASAASLEKTAGGAGLTNALANGDGGITAAHNPLVVGVHLRSLEGSCDSRIDELEKYAKKQAAEMAADDNAKNNGGGNAAGSIVTKAESKELVAQRRAALKSQCVMDPSYVLSVAKGEAANGNQKRDHMADSGTPTVIFVADDNQQPARVDKLIAALNSVAPPDGTDGSSSASSASIKAYRLRNVFTPKGTQRDGSVTQLAAMLKRVLGNEWVASATTSSNGNKKLHSVSSLKCDVREQPHIRNRFSTFAELLFMQLDFWALAGSDVMVGNQLSTLSLNVCRRRLAMGLRCDNFVGVEGM